MQLEMGMLSWAAVPMCMRFRCRVAVRGQGCMQVPTGRRQYLSFCVPCGLDLSTPSFPLPCLQVLAQPLPVELAQGQHRRAQLSRQPLVSLLHVHHASAFKSKFCNFQFNFEAMSLAGASAPTLHIPEQSMGAVPLSSFMCSCSSVPSARVPRLPNMKGSCGALLLGAHHASIF